MRTLTLVTVLGALLVPVSAANAVEYTIKMKFDDGTGRVYFDKSRLVIQPGDTVKWVQDDAYNPHNVAAYPTRIPSGTRPFESPMLKKKGQTWSMTFLKQGTYDYHCHPHEAVGMRATIVVGRESTPAEFRKDSHGGSEHRHDGGGHMHTSENRNTDTQHGHSEAGHSS